MAIKRIQLRKLWKSVVRLQGLDPLTAELSTGQMSRYGELISDRLREGWEAELWPQLMKIEQRQFRATYAAGTTYAEDDEVYYTDGTDEGYFVSLADANMGNTPDFDEATDYWEQVGETFLPTIDFDQSWEDNEIGAIDVKRGVFREDPRLNAFSGVIDDCRIVEDAVLVGGDEVPARPFIRFRPRPLMVTLTEWDKDRNYAGDDLAYEKTQGECYRAVTANSGTVPGTDATKWALVEVPEFLGTYLKWAVYSDLLNEDQARSRALGRANEELDRLRGIHLEQSGEVRRAKFGR